MGADIHEESGLMKAVWSDADFDAMTWHDVTVHGLSVQPGVSYEAPLPRLLLDIDYIVQWVAPVAPATHFSFWVAPATLVFEDVWDMEGDFDFKGVSLSLEIDGIRRSTPGDAHSDTRWHIEGHYFEFKFRASGFRQYVRRAPQHVQRLALTRSEREGLSFAEVAFG